MTIWLAVFLLTLPWTFAAAEVTPGQAISWTDFSFITGITFSRNYIWFGTTEGILRYHRFDEKWYPPITVSDELPGRIIRRLAVSPDEFTVAVELDEGIYSLDFNSQHWFVESRFPTEYWRDSRPHFPLPNILMPFGYYLQIDGRITDSYFREFDITSMIDDQFNYFFMGSWGLGPLRIGSSDLRGEFIPCGLIQKRTDAIYIEGDSIWLGGNEGDWKPQSAATRMGVTLYDRSSESFSHIEPRIVTGFESEIVYDITGDTGNLYFGTRRGLTIMPRHTRQFMTLGRGDGLPSLEVTALAARGDTVWVGTASGLAVYLPGPDSVLVIGKKSLGKLFITDLLIVDSLLFIGSDHGAFYLSFPTRQIGRLEDSLGIVDGAVRQIAHSGSTDELFVATRDGAAVVDLKTEQANEIPFTREAGGVYAIAGDSTYIAAAMHDGLLLVDRQSGKTRRFTERDGLLSVKITTLELEDNTLWIGSEEGLTKFLWINPNRVD